MHPDLIGLVMWCLTMTSENVWWILLFLFSYSMRPLEVRGHGVQVMTWMAVWVARRMSWSTSAASAFFSSRGSCSRRRRRPLGASANEVSARRTYMMRAFLLFFISSSSSSPCFSDSRPRRTGRTSRSRQRCLPAVTDTSVFETWN